LNNLSSTFALSIVQNAQAARCLRRKLKIAIQSALDLIPEKLTSATSTAWQVLIVYKTSFWPVNPAAPLPKTSPVCCHHHNE
jgi:hypothetical protein